VAVAAWLLDEVEPQGAPDLRAVDEEYLAALGVSSELPVWRILANDVVNEARAA